MNFLSRSLNFSSSNRKNDCGLLNRAFVQVQSEKMSYRKMPSHFRPPAPVSPAATPARELEVQPLSLLETKLRRNAVRSYVSICMLSGLLAPSFWDTEAVASHHSSLPSLCKPALLLELKAPWLIRMVAYAALDFLLGTCIPSQSIKEFR